MMNEAQQKALFAQRSEQRTEAIKQRDAMRGLLSHPGWEIVARFIRGQIAERDGAIWSNASCQYVDYVRGEGGMLRLILAYPQVVIQANEDVLLALEQERKDAASTSKGSSQRSSRSAPADTAADDTSGWTAEDD